MRLFLAGVVMLGIAAAGAHAGEVHKWVDDAGVTHYGESPPGNRASTPIETAEPEPRSSVPVTSEERRENQNRVIEQLSEERIRKRDAKEIADAEKQKNDGACEQLLGRLAMLKDGGRLYWVKPDGQREYMSSAMRKNKQAEIEAKLKKKCR